MLRASAGRNRRTRVTSALLVGLLTLGVPGSGLNVLASEPAASDTDAFALSVGSDPQGAAVYVNGRLQGATPLTLNGIAPGEHRVRLVKDGYLENSRVVSVKSGRPGTVQVKMTPARSEARHTVQQEPGEGGGGGGGKVLWIGLGVAALGAGAYFLLRNKNDPPSAGTIAATPPTALQSATIVSLTAQGASDPDGDTLTFSWNFGDGGSGSGQTVTHVFNNAGAANVTVTASDGKESASATGTVSVRSLSGTWRGILNGGFTTTVVLTQSGTSLSGTYRDQFPGNGTVAGSVSDPRSVTFRVSIPGVNPFTFSGNANPDVDQLSGVANGSGFANDPWSLTRQ